jgi:hypothetical protein
MENEENTQEKPVDGLFLQMADDLKKIRDALEVLEKIGINEEMQVLYIHDKTRIGKTKIKEILQAQKQFLKNVVKQ